MSLRELIVSGDSTGQTLLAEWDRENAEAAEIANNGGQVAFVDVQVVYRLKHTTHSVREPYIRQVAPGALVFINKLAMYVRAEYVAVSIEAQATEGNTRSVNVMAADILAIEIVSEPHIPDQNQDDERRAKLRRSVAPE